MEQVVTVGLDGSAESLAAAQWGADEAERRRARLRLLHAWSPVSPETADSPGTEVRNQWARQMVHDTAAELKRDRPGLRVEEELVAEETERALLDAAEASGMLVLGSRGLERMASFFFGDISLHVVARAERPVVLVRADGRDGWEPELGADERPVVVGLSLHDPQDEPLEFAFEAAAARGAPLRVVHGRTLPLRASGRLGVDPAVSQDFADRAQRELEEALGPWRRRFPQTLVVDDVRLVYSQAQAVIAATGDSGLLVIGRRKHRPPLAPRIGPVAQAAVHHVACPVAVVPHE